MSEQGQEGAAWNRVEYFGAQHGFRGQLCEWCQDRPELPWAGAEPLILTGGEWLHPDCAESMARGRASEARLAKWEREAKPEPAPRPVPAWLHSTVLVGCILGLGLLPFGFIWTLPVLTVLAGFSFVLGLAVLDHLD